MVTNYLAVIGVIVILGTLTVMFFMKRYGVDTRPIEGHKLHDIAANHMLLKKNIEAHKTVASNLRIGAYTTYVQYIEHCQRLGINSFAAEHFKQLTNEKERAA